MIVYSKNSNYKLVEYKEENKMKKIEMKELNKVTGGIGIRIGRGIGIGSILEKDTIVWPVVKDCKEAIAISPKKSAWIF